MKKTVSLSVIAAALFVMLIVLTGCGGTTASATDYDSRDNVQSTMAVTDDLVAAQPTPTDINYSLERYNLIKRAYWVNGQREKALSYPCAVEKPLGYIVLFADNGAVVGRYVVDGKVTSLNSYLSPDSEYYELVDDGSWTRYNEWLADVDGSYGENDSGIFFFTPDGNYYEWTGTYLYTDVPVQVDNPILYVEGE